VASSRAEEPPAGSGIALPPGVSRSTWWTWCRATRGRHHVFRAGVFVLGLLLILVGATMWLASVLLAAPLMFVGLWVWSREFHWGHRLLRGFLRRAARLWSRVRASPVRWSFMTVCGVAVAWAGYWAWGQYGPFA
jgi:hypothetical protein